MLPIFRERVWGRDSLAPFYPNLLSKERIGEVWFTYEENWTSTGKKLGDLLREQPELLGEGADPASPGICPILLKLLFTTERLSVQVHPDDDYAREHHNSLGKTEAWYVVDAKPPAEVAVGFKEELPAPRLDEVARSGEIESLLDWRKVTAGETIFVPAGTVHAIGAGLTVGEVQENSDITYRLYDYGRPRELHLEHGTRVSKLGPHTEPLKPIPLAPGREELTACPYFRMERLRPLSRFTVPGDLPTYVIAILLKGKGRIEAFEANPGQAWLLPAQGADVTIEAPGSEWLLAYRANEPIGFASESVRT